MRPKVAIGTQWIFSRLANFCPSRSLSVLASVRANGSRAEGAETNRLFAEISAYIGNPATSGTSLARKSPQAGRLLNAQRPAADNRLVAGSSPPSPTTQSCAHGDFPVRCESPRTGGDLCTHFVSAICRLDCRERFGVFVSALENCVSRRWRLALVEIWFECRISGTENQAFRGHRDGSAECLLWRRTSPRDRRLIRVGRHLGWFRPAGRALSK